MEQKKKRRKTQMPGEKSSGTGKYKEIGPRGGKVKKAKKISVTSKSKMPPTGKSDRKWKPVK